MVTDNWYKIINKYYKMLINIRRFGNFKSFFLLHRYFYRLILVILIRNLIKQLEIVAKIW